MKLQNIAKTSLGYFPTPLIELKNLSRLLQGPRIWMKRDDLTGLALGGNKTRKLEYILAEALALNADTIITAGAAQSNHCRQTAAAAAILQLECHLVLGGEAPPALTGNLLLNKLFKSHIHWAGENRKGEDIPELAAQLERQGKKVYVVPYGGSSPLGAIAYAQALTELQTQLTVDSFSHIIFASSSGATQAGLMLGKKLLQAKSEIHGIQIDKTTTAKSTLSDFIIDLARKAAARGGLELGFSHEDLHLNPNYLGDGYGIMGNLEKKAINLVAQTEGILLDPVYTGRAMGGLIDMVRRQRFEAKDSILFWHTGGTPALFSEALTMDI